MMERVDAAQKEDNWGHAKSLLSEIREMRKESTSEDGAARVEWGKREDPYILQRLALATYKSKLPSPLDALREARDLLSLLEPQVSNDTETLGLWGSVHKRLWNLTHEAGYLDQAIRGYERGFYLRNDYYNGINYAYLLNERAGHTADLAEAIADFVQARRVRSEVISICEEWLADNTTVPTVPETQRSAQFLARRYWVLATIAEARIGLEDTEGERNLQEALDLAPEEWMRQSTREQVDKLKALLLESPLQKLPLLTPPTLKFS